MLSSDVWAWFVSGIAITYLVFVFGGWFRKPLVAFLVVAAVVASASAGMSWVFGIAVSPYHVSTYVQAFLLTAAAVALRSAAVDVRDV